MTRGNQRELARAKNAKKQQQQTKSASSSTKNAGVSTDKRMERDADIMRQKQMKAQTKKEDDDKHQSTHKVVKHDPLKA